MRRFLVRAANGGRQTELVRRGSRTGGSHGDARVISFPRLGGLGLGGIQSGYGDGGYADAGCAAAPPLVAPAMRGVIATVPHPVRFRMSRRLTRERAAGRGASVGIRALLLRAVVGSEGKR